MWRLIFRRGIAAVAGVALSVPLCAAQAPAKLPQEHLAPISVTSRVLASAPVFGRPGQLTLIGSTLIVVDASGDPWFHAIDVASGRILVSFGRKGAGPGEFEFTPWVAVARSNPPAIWALDSPRGRLTRFVLMHDSAGSTAHRPHISGTVALSRGPHGVPLRVVSLSPNRFAGVAGARDTFRVAFYDTTGKRVGAAGLLARPDDAIPTASIGKAYQGHACASPDGSRLARTYAYAGRLDLVAADGGDLGSARVPFAFGPVLDDSPLNVTHEFKGGADEVRAGYYQCAATSEFVIAKFSGKRNKEFKSQSSYSEYLHVFDWRGNFVGAIRLDHETIGLALSADGHRLFTTTTWDDAEPAIRVTDIGHALDVIRRR